MARLILLRGYSGSGKTTIAKNWLSESPNTRLRLNRDDLRALLFDQEGVLSSDKESIITQIQRDSSLKALQAGKDVIIDDTNLRLNFAREWANFAAKNAFDFEVRDIAIPWQECVRRDSHRMASGSRSVGAEVIKNQARRFPYPWPEVKSDDVVEPLWEPYVFIKGLPYVNIFDLDGTLAKNVTKRGFYDWTRVGEDYPNEYVVDLLQSLRFSDNNTDGIARTIFLSGRDSICYDITHKWIDQHAGFYNLDALYMRAKGDMRPDDIVKYELFNEHIRGKFNVRFVVDDRRKVCKLWYAMGLPLLMIGDPDANF